MGQITINELLKMCKAEIKKGNGDKHIVVSNDNEGNGCHGMFFGFTPMDDYFASITSDSNYYNSNDTIVLG